MKVPANLIGALFMWMIWAMPIQALAHHDETAEWAMYEELGEPCSSEEINLKTHVENEVTFITGGIGFCESQEMRRISHEYPLELMFLQQTAKRQSFLANIPVQITNSNGSLVVDTITEGPLLVARMPPGRYVITASYNGIVKTHHLRIDENHQRIVFSWPTQY